MRKIIALLSAILIVCGTSLTAADSTFLDYQNYNHGYCPECSCYPCRCDVPCPEEAPCDPCPVPNPCNPCDPCAPVCGTECGVSICAIGIGLAAVAAAAAIIIASGNGGSTEHLHN